MKLDSKEDGSHVISVSGVWRLIIRDVTAKPDYAIQIRNSKKAKIKGSDKGIEDQISLVLKRRLCLKERNVLPKEDVVIIVGEGHDSRNCPNQLEEER